MPKVIAGKWSSLERHSLSIALYTGLDHKQKRGISTPPGSAGTSLILHKKAIAQVTVQNKSTAKCHSNFLGGHNVYTLYMYMDTSPDHITLLAWCMGVINDINS